MSTIRFFSIFLLLLSFSSAAQSRCVDGRYHLTANCQKIQGLADFLNDNSATLPGGWSEEQSRQARDCAKGVRKEQMATSNLSKACPVADEQAFKIILQVGDKELQKQIAASPGHKDVDDVVFVDNQCFGSVCYRIPPNYLNRYRPFGESSSASTGAAQR